MVIFHSYVSLPEGNLLFQEKKCVGKRPTTASRFLKLQASQLLKWRWLKFPLDLGWKPARKIRSCVKQLQQVVSERWVSLAIAKLTRLYIIILYITIAGCVGSSC